jgi:hypothetical protein
MTPDAVELRLKFLVEAARTLAIPAPAVSANLGAAHHSLLTAEERDVGLSQKEWDMLRREICGACGNMMVPGWTYGISHRVRPTKTSKTLTEPSAKQQKQLVYSCLRCDRRTVQTVQSRPPKHIRTNIKTKEEEPLQAVSSKVSATEDSRVTKSVNATSKQRKKARKGGLQAMLDRNKTTKSAQGNQLDLMDFMQ